MPVKIPGAAVQTVSPQHDDLAEATTALLRSLYLLPTSEDFERSKELKTFFTGAPDSVAVIEAGATAASKWWATGIAVSGTAVVARITTIWDRLGRDGGWNQPFALLAITIILAAMAIGISYLLGSDVRGRSAAMVATLNARHAVAEAMLVEAGKAFQHQSTSLSLGDGSLRSTQRPSAGSNRLVRSIAKSSGDEPGWALLACREQDGAIQYLLAKGTCSEWVDASRVEF